MHILFQFLALAVFAAIAMVAPQDTKDLNARLVTPEWKYTESLTDTRNAHLQTAVKSVHTDIPAEVVSEETAAQTIRTTPRSQTASLLNALKRLFGTPKDGQVLTAKNGAYTWQTLPTVMQSATTVAPRPAPSARAGGGSARGGGGSPQPASLPEHNHEGGDRGGQISIGSATTGVLAASRGGTGFETYSAGDLLIGTNGSLEKLGKGNQGEVLSVSGSSLVWKDADAAALTGNNARYVNVDGDTMSGALTILTPGDLGLNVVGTISGSTLVVNGTSTFAGNATFDTDTLFVNATTNKVGIGTTSPSSSLSVMGAANSSTTDLGVHIGVHGSPRIIFATGTAGQTDIIDNNVGTLRFIINGTVRGYFNDYGMQIGSLGIGVDPSTIGLTRMQIDTIAASLKGFVIKGAASQTANLQEWQDSDGGVLSKIASNGSLTIGGAYPNDANVTISSSNPTLTINSTGIGYSQTISIIDGGFIYFPTGLTAASIRSPADNSAMNMSGGYWNLPASKFGIGISVPASQLHVVSLDAARTGLIVQGAVSQSANLQEWQNSDGNILAKIGSNGALTAPSLSGSALVINGTSTLNGAVGLNTALGIEDYSLYSKDTTYGRKVGFFWNAGGAEGGVKSDNQLNLKSGSQVIIAPSGASYGLNFSMSDSNIYIGNQVGSVVFQPTLADRTGLIVKGFSSQTANLQEWQNSDGDVLAKVTSSGSLVIGGTYPSGANLQIRSNFNPAIKLLNTGTGYQADITLSGNRVYLPEGLVIGSIHSSAGGSILTLGADAIYTSGGTNRFLVNNTGLSSQFGVVPNAANVVGAIIKGAASQSANLQEWQNSDGTALAVINGTGGFLSTVKSHVNNYAIKLAPSYNIGYESNQFDALLIDTANLSSHGTYSTGVASAIRVLDKYGGTAMRVAPIGTTYFEPSTGYATAGVVIRSDASADYYNDDYDYLRIQGDRVNGIYGASAPHNMRFFRITGVGDAEVMTVSREGNTGLGTKTPETRLEVVGTMSGQALVVHGSSHVINSRMSTAPHVGSVLYASNVVDTGNAVAWALDSSALTAGFETKALSIRNNGTEKAYFRTDGKLVIGSGFSVGAAGDMNLTNTSQGYAPLTITTSAAHGNEAGIKVTQNYTGFPAGLFILGHAGAQGIIIKGASSQSANLQEWQESDGTALMSITAGGMLRWRDSAESTMLGLSIYTTNGLELNSGSPDGFATTTLRLGNLLVANDGFVKFRDNAGNNIGAFTMDTSNVLTLGHTSHVLKVSSPSTSFISSGGATLAKIDGTGQVQAGTGGLVTKVVSGACSDSSFTTDTNGTICVDSSNGRLYFRYGDAWHYTAQTAGFQIPNLVRNGVNETDGLNVGDAVIGRIDERMEDGALHGIWEKFDLQSEISATLLAHPELLGSIGTGSGATAETLTMEDIQDLAIQGSLVVYGNARFAGDVNVQGTLTLGGKQAGMATVRAGQTQITVNFEDDFGNTPLVTATPQGVPMAFWGVTDVTAGSFTIQLSSPAAADIRFAWMALPHDEALPGEAAIEETSSASSASSESSEASESSATSEAASSESSASSEDSASSDSSSSESSAVSEHTESSAESSSSSESVTEEPQA